MVTPRTTHRRLFNTLEQGTSFNLKTENSREFYKTTVIS